jgi:nitrate/nitrite transporter NarK
LTPLSITMFMAGIVGGILLDGVGARPMLLLGGGIVIVAMLGMTFYVSDATTLAEMLVVIGLGMDAFNVALLMVAPGTEKGVSMGIMTTFRGIGGYFLNEALRHTVTFDQAFTNLCMTATAVVGLSFLLMAYFVFRIRKVARPTSAPAAQA